MVYKNQKKKKEKNHCLQGQQSEIGRTSNHSSKVKKWKLFTSSQDVYGKINLKKKI